MTNEVRNRSWIFVINNYTDREWELCVSGVDGNALYLYAAQEKRESGTPHIQGYIRWKSAKSLKNCKRVFPTAHWQCAKGTADENRTYCSKENGAKTEFGSRPKGPGSRTDLAGVRDLVAAGGGIRAVVDENPTLTALLYAERVAKHVEPGREGKPTVIWLWGRTGTGKTRVALEQFPGAWISGANFKWWDGYDAHKAVILDDMRQDSFKFNQLIRMFDYAPYRVEVKGGTRQLLATHIVVTSPYNPERMWTDTDEDVEQLVRRVEFVFEVK